MLTNSVNSTESNTTGSIKSFRCFTYFFIMQPKIKLVCQTLAVTTPLMRQSLGGPSGGHIGYFTACHKT